MGKYGICQCLWILFVDIPEWTLYVWVSSEANNLFLKLTFSNDLGTQISKLTGCGFTRIGNLNFNFPYGGCFSTPNEIVLCFSSLETDQCRRGTDPLGEFETISNSVYQHSYIRLSASEGKFSSILREHLHKVACKTICFFSISLDCFRYSICFGTV